MTAQDRSSTDLLGDSTVQQRSVFVSVAEAARLLGVSTATVKRRIRDGTLEAEPLSRPQGIIEYRVRLPRDVPAPLTEPASDVTPPPSERSDSKPAALTDSAHVTTHDLSAAITAAVAPLVDRMAVQDATITQQAETIQRQAETIGELREDRGRLTAELAAERAARSTLEARTAPQAGDALPGARGQPLADVGAVAAACADPAAGARCRAAGMGAVNGEGRGAILLAVILIVVLIVLLLFVLPDLGGMDPGGGPVP